MERKGSQTLKTLIAHFQPLSAFHMKTHTHILRWPQRKTPKKMWLKKIPEAKTNLFELGFCVYSGWSLTLSGIDGCLWIFKMPLRRPPAEHREASDGLIPLVFSWILHDSVYVYAYTQCMNLNQWLQRAASALMPPWGDMRELVDVAARRGIKQFVWLSIHFLPATRRTCWKQNCCPVCLYISQSLKFHTSVFVYVCICT